MNKLLAVAMAAILVLLASPAFASYLKSDYEEQAPQAPQLPEPVVPRPIPPPPPPPQPSNPLTDIVRRVRVQEGYDYRGLTVFTVEITYVADDTAYLSVQEAIAAGTLTVREKGDGTVPSLIVENTGKEPVLMLGGEMLLGGRQNRVLREDVLLPARSGPIEVPVFCIEQGRWSRGPEDFKYKSSLAPVAVRGSAQAGESQAAIWAGVRQYQENLKVESSTRDLQAVHDSPEVCEAVADYRTHVADRCWRRPAVGMVVARYGEVVGADIFANAALFRKHRDRLLESYALDCVAYGRVEMDRKWRAPSASVAEEFLRRAFSADYAWRVTPGSGRLLAVSGAGLTGSALVLRDNVLHGCLFPAGEIIMQPPQPVPLPRPMPVE